MKKRINWNDFEATSENITVDFEHLCRILFKRYYADDSSIILNQVYNNPGIETDPVLINGRSIGFQAKYFTNNVSYKDILDSVKKIESFYCGKIDEVIIFSNKNINDKTKSFDEIKEILSRINCKYTLFCNESILDLINENEKYSNLKFSFFNKVSITNEWIREKLDISLLDLEPRYTKDFHVRIDDEKYLNCILRNKNFFDYLDSLKQDAIDELKHDYYLDTILKNEILNTISSLTIPNKDDICKIFDWYDCFQSHIEKINKYIEMKSKDLEVLYEKKR